MHLAQVINSYNHQCLFLTVLRQCLGPQKEIIIFPRVLCLSSPVNCSIPRCCVPWTDPGRPEDLPCRIPVSAAQLYSSLLFLATWQVLKGVFCSVHSKLMLVKVVVDNLGMSKTKYKCVYAVLWFYSIWNIYIWCRYIYYFVKNTVFCISVMHF